MSRETYESLFQGPSGTQPGQDLVRALAQAGRLRRAAHDLATDEMLEGTWVEELMDESEMRLAADDRSVTDRTLSGGGYSVRVQGAAGDVFTVEQTAGPAGATIRVDASWIPLDPGVAVELPVRSMPSELTLMDRSGKEIRLR
jgi:hypothetical protein